MTSQVNYPAYAMLIEQNAVVCHSISCPYPTEYAVSPATPTTDTVCAPIATACLAKEYLAVGGPLYHWPPFL